MSDLVPQCITCKFNPCKWFTNKEREQINNSFHLCKYFKTKTEFNYIYKEN